MSTKKKILIAVVLLIVIVGSIGAIMFFKPHRDVQSTKTDFKLQASEIVAEYLMDIQKADEKYLDEEGNSKVLEISGTIFEVSEDFNGNKVVLLKEANDKAGVSATFSAETNENAKNLNVGDKITIKGVIRSGASYDEDLEMYENVLLGQSDIVN